MFRTLETRARMHRAAHSGVHRSSGFKDLHGKQTINSTSSQEFNFQIIFRSGKMNTKADALTRMLITDGSESAQRTENRYQTLTSDRIDVLATDSEVVLYQRVKDDNKTNELCNEYRQAISENKLKLHSTELKHCEVVDGVLFRKGLL